MNLFSSQGSINRTIENRGFGPLGMYAIKLLEERIMMEEHVGSFFFFGMSMRHHMHARKLLGSPVKAFMRFWPWSSKDSIRISS